MADLNIRGIDSALKAQLKMDALRLGRTLREHCVIRLGGDPIGGVNGTGGVDGDDEGAKAGGGGKRASVSNMREAKGVSKQLHPVQPLRDELVGGSGHLQASTHAGHTVYRAGAGSYCSDCKVNF